MVRELVPDASWQRVAPLLPPPRPKKKLGRPRADDRAALEAIVFVLRSGIPWEMLPRKQFGLSGMTALRRLEEWTRTGVWQTLQGRLLDELGLRGKVDFSRASIDSSSVRASKPGSDSVPTDGSWNGPRPGRTSSADFESATNAGTMSTSASSSSVAASCFRAASTLTFVRCSPPPPRPARPCLSVRPFPKRDDDGVGVREGWRGRQGRADRAVECPGRRGDRPRRRRGDRRLRHRLPLRGLAASSPGARCPRTRPRALVAVLLRAVSLLPRAAFRASAAPGVRRLHQGLGGAGLPPGDVTTRR